MDELRDELRRDDDDLLKAVFGGMVEQLHAEAIWECSISVSALFWE